MMECQLQNLSASGFSEEDIPKGKVESVRREWSVKEDGVLAHKLQTEEIKHHYGHNKERNQLVRSDIQEARSAQRNEEEEAAMIQKAYEDWIRDQQNEDEFLAKQLQEKILEEHLQRQKEIEEEDKRIALEIQRKEKARLQRKREEREIRQAERASAELNGAHNTSSIKSIEDLGATQGISAELLEKKISDLCFDPPENLTAEELCQFREHYDAELARILQEQEMKMQGENSQDRQIAIEAQDRELAKVLQEQERARLRKAREKTRQKALFAQQQQQGGSSNTMDERMPLLSPSGEIRKNQVVDEEKFQKPELFLSDQRSTASNFFGDPVDNIATAIDPTYNNRMSPLASPSVSQVSYPGPLSVPGTDVHPCNASGVKKGFSPDFEDKEVASPPYMPIQGTYRSLEKRKKCKKRKENCKTQ